MNYQQTATDQAREADGQQTEKSRLDCLSSSILGEIELRNLDIKPIQKFLGPISEGTLGEIYGPRGIGKTFLRDVISICLTRGIDLGPFECGNAAGVLIVDGEMPLTLLKDRQGLTQNVGEPLKPLEVISNEFLSATPSLPCQTHYGDPPHQVDKDQRRPMGRHYLRLYSPGVKNGGIMDTINGFLLQLMDGKRRDLHSPRGQSGDQREHRGEDQLDYIRSFPFKRTWPGKRLPVRRGAHSRPYRARGGAVHAKVSTSQRRVDLNIVSQRESEPSCVIRRRLYANINLQIFPLTRHTFRNPGCCIRNDRWIARKSFTVGQHEYRIDIEKITGCQRKPTS